jgi:DsbC/DsbD-like thiol-disulfide interchange protein
MSHSAVRFACALPALAWWLAASAGGAEAQGATGSGRHVAAALVAETNAVQPGRPLWVGVRLRMEPGWHTYWHNPGDSGLPTRVRWTLPPGFVAGEPRWPYPRRFAAGPLMSYGYEHELLLPVEIRVPASLAVKEVRIGAHVDWLECREACLPGKADLSLTLPVRAAAALGPESAAFAAARRRLPVPAPHWRVSASAMAGEVVLDVAPAGRLAFDKAYFYAATPRVLDYAKPQALERWGAGYRLVLARDPNGVTPGRLAGVLLVETGGHERAVEIDAKMGSTTTPTR